MLSIDSKKNISLKNKVLSNKYVSDLMKNLGQMCKEIKIKKKDIEIKTTIENLRALLYFLKNHTLYLFSQLVEIAAIDTPQDALRFTVMYKLYSVHYTSHIYVKIQTDEGTALPSVIELYASAGWLERELWDLFGIFFSEHTDLRRLLNDYGFKGHPLRKDFPMTGFIEVYYNDSTKRLVYEPVELAQEYRVFTFEKRIDQPFKNNKNIKI